MGLGRLAIGFAGLGALAASAGTPAPTGSLAEAFLSVRLSAGKSTYALGELIPLELEFVGKADGDWYWSTQAYDRSGRMAFETYGVSPPGGFEDPLDDYFHGDIYGGFIGGGLGGWQALDGSPFRLHVQLNEWIRFTEPGRFLLTVSSRRLERHSGRPTPLVSAAPVEIVIVEDGGARAELELERATAALEGGHPDQAKQAALILRHLGTEGAALALLKHYEALDARASFDLLAGLVASPYRPLLVARMEAQVDAGDLLPGDFVERLSYLKCLLEMPRGTGDYPSRRARYDDLRKEYDARWIAATSKGGFSKAALQSSLQKLTVGLDGETASALADGLSRHPTEAAAAFLDLPPAQQSYLLAHQWALVDRPWMGPALTSLYEKSTNETGVGAPVGDLALKRISERDRSAGRRLVLEEITTGRHGVGFDVLSGLDDGTLPDLDVVLQQRFLREDGDERADHLNRETTAWLIWRYGSSALRSFVASAADGPRSDCGLRGALLAYEMKHYFEPGLGRLGSRLGEGGSVACVLRALAQRVWDERVEVASIAHLASRDVDEVAETAQVLGRYGSARVREPLLLRLARWEAEWRGRSAELEARRSDPGSSPERIENALTNALFENPRVVLSLDDETRIQRLCVTARGCANVEAWIRSRAR
jgi:hypothetical protein